MAKVIDNASLPKTQEEARRLGVKSYFDGKACCRGHVSRKYALTRGCFQCIKESTQRWKESKPPVDPIAHRNKERQYYSQRKEEICRRQRERRAADPMFVHKNRAGARKQKARRLGAPGWHTAKEIIELFNKQKSNCAACLSPLGDKYHADHIYPLARGGCNCIRNIQILCVPCNQNKNDKDPFQWAQQNGRLF